MGLGLNVIDSAVVPRLFLKSSIGGYKAIKSYHPISVNIHFGFDTLFKIPFDGFLCHAFIGLSAGPELVGTIENFHENRIVQAKVYGRLGLALSFADKDDLIYHGFEATVEVPIFTKFFGNQGVDLVIYRPIHLNLSYRFAI